jgi:hypothetical protein
MKKSNYEVIYDEVKSGWFDTQFSNHWRHTSGAINWWDVFCSAAGITTCTNACADGNTA